MTTKKTKFQKAVARIERSNKTFKRAGQATKIMMVAEDVLAMLDARRLNATEGTYVQLPPEPEKGKRCDDLSDFLKLPRLPACDVCAIGAAMVASTIRLDHVPVERNEFTDIMKNDISFVEYVEENGISGNMSKQALAVFPEPLLREMEEAFENQSYGYSMRGARARLRAIYANLIKNKGKKFTQARDDNDVVWPRE